MPLLTATVPKTTPPLQLVAPLLNVTVPTVTAAPVPCSVTVAVNVTDCPRFGFTLLELIVVSLLSLSVKALCAVKPDVPPVAVK